MFSAGLLLIFLLSGTAICEQSQDSLGWPDNLSDVSHNLHHPEDGSPVDSSRSDALDRISSQRERILLNRANLRDKVQDLSEAYSQNNSQKHEKSPGNSSNQAPGNSTSSTNFNRNDTEMDRRGYFENYMNIKVVGVSVRAVNTVEGGSAAATSNIIIEPVQIIDLASEVAEKLR